MLFQNPRPPATPIRRYVSLAGPFSTQPSGPRPVGCFSSAAADRPVWIQIWGLRSRLEKQPTDLRRHHRYMRDGTLVSTCQKSAKKIAVAFGPGSVIL